MAVQIYSYQESVTAWRAFGRPNLSPSGSIPKPSAANTGPRVAITGSTLVGNDAISAAQANGNVLVGRRISDVVLTQPEHGLLTFRDCEIIGTNYGVDCWFDSEVTPPVNPSTRVQFEYCLFEFGATANVAGTNYTAKFCEMRNAVDCAKSYGNTEIYGCYMHGLWDPDGEAHGDVLQIQSGSNFLIHFNTMICLNSDISPARPGGIGNGVTQFGAPGGDCTDVKFYDNWVDGGVYTLRGGGQWNDGTPYNLDIEFRRNKHGRAFGDGPIFLMGSFDGGRAVSDYDSSNIYEDNGQPVLG